LPRLRPRRIPEPLQGPRGDHVQNDQIENMKIKTTKF
jgi:hypothetical protein